jgi:hypothetical protein
VDDRPPTTATADLGGYVAAAARVRGLELAPDRQEAVAVQLAALLRAAAVLDGECEPFAP